MYSRPAVILCVGVYVLVALNKLHRHHENFYTENLDQDDDRMQR